MFDVDAFFLVIYPMVYCSRKVNNDQFSTSPNFPLIFDHQIESRERKSRNVLLSATLFNKQAKYLYPIFICKFTVALQL